VEFEELIPYAGAREALREVLFGLMLSAMVNLHVYGPTPATPPSSSMRSRATWLVFRTARATGKPLRRTWRRSQVRRR